MKMWFYYKLLICGNNLLFLFCFVLFFLEIFFFWCRAGLIVVSPAASIFLVHDSGRNGSCVVQVNRGKIQSKSILRIPAEAKVTVMGPVKGTMVMFIGTINTLLLTQFSDPQVQLVLLQSFANPTRLSVHSHTSLLNNFPSNQLQETWKMYYDAVY